jgi:hypothetical protein
MFNRKHPFFLFLWRKGWVLSQRIPRASSLPTLKVQGPVRSGRPAVPDGGSRGVCVGRGKAKRFPLQGRRGISATPPIHFNYPDLPRKKGCFLINTIRLILKLGSGYWDFFG